MNVLKTSRKASGPCCLFCVGEKSLEEDLDPVEELKSCFWAATGHFTQKIEFVAGTGGSPAGRGEAATWRLGGLGGSRTSRAWWPHNTTLRQSPGERETAADPG